ncbi:TIGR04076 family protein [Candidatus Bipolaricaulota bacterium]
MSKIRVTVVKRELFTDIVDAHWGPKKSGRELSPCEILREGQSFIVEDPPFEMPEGFCSMAWADVHGDIEMMLYGPPDYWKEKPFLVCCTDGFRPVVFTIEAVPEGE